MTFAVRAHGSGATFAVKVVPGAARDRIAGVLGDALKVQVAAPPEGGKANARLCELLADALGISVRAVTVQSGHGNPRKVIAIDGVDAQEVSRRLVAALPR